MHVYEPWTLGVVELELLCAQADRVAAERGAAAGPDPGHQRQRPAAVGEQFGAVAEQRDRASPAELSQPGGEHPDDWPDAYLVTAIDPDVSTTRPTCGSCSGAVITLVISHGWLLTGTPSVRWAWARMCARVLNRPPGVRLSMRFSPSSRAW